MKNKNFKIILFFFFNFFLAASLVWAATDYESQAELVVEGKFESPIQCANKQVFRSVCPKQTAYRTPLKIKKIIKGNLTLSKDQNIEIVFCTGGPTAEPVRGEEGIYYFKKAPTAISNLYGRYWQLTYSNQVIHAAGELPACQ